MLSFQAELCRAIFPHHIVQSRTELILRADNIRPYSGNRANGATQSWAIFPHHIAQSRTVLISRADDIRPYSRD